MVSSMDPRSLNRFCAYRASLIWLVPTVLLLVLCLPAPAAAVVCTAEVDRQKVAVGDQIVLTVSVQGAFAGGPDVVLPSIVGVDVRSGGTNQSFSFVNNEVQASVAYTFYLRPTIERGFTVPALPIVVDGREYKTQPITIEVLPAGTQSEPARGSPDPVGAPSPSNSPNQPRKGRADSAGGPGDEVFISTTVDKERVYVGEQLVLSFKYYRQSNPLDNPQYNPSRTEGFWREDLPPESHYRRTVAGRNYLVTEIKYALFPTRSGELVIEPAELSFPEDLFSRFFSSRRRQRGPRILRTDPITVNVLPLPTPQPENFSGIVANRVTLAASVDRDSVPRGEPVGLKVTLNANGFLQSLDELSIEVPDGVRLHDATSDLRKDTARGVLLSRYAVEKVLVPSQEGNTELAPVSLSYFDPTRGQYETARSRGVSFHVTPSDLPVAGDEASGFLRTEIARLGNDLAFVHAAGERLRRRQAPLVASWGWWAVALSPLLALVFVRLALNRRQQLLRDPVGTRRRQALTTARRVLQDARDTTEPAARLSAAARAITGFVADRCDRLPAALSTADVEQYATALGCEETGRKLSGILVSSDQTRFGGAVDAVAGDRDVDALERVATLLAELEKAANRQQPSDRSLRLWSVATLIVALVAVGGSEPVRAQETGTGTAVGPAPGPDPIRLVAEGNRAYTDGDIEAALRKYQHALAQGVNDAVLHYNLGNAYARTGRLGKAIVCYLRAERLDPRNQDIKTNLAWVRAHIRDLELSSGQLPPVVAQLYGLGRSLSLDQWSVVLLLVLWPTAVLIAWTWYRGHVDYRLRRWLITCAALLTVAIAIVGWRWYDERVRNLAVVVVNGVAVRSGPAESFPVVFEIHDGLTLTWRGERDGWSQVGLGGDWVGWVPGGSVDQVR